MLIRVNKKISSNNSVKYAALSSALNAATYSGVWHDEDTANLGAQKRRNRIKLMREKRVPEANYDA